MAKALVILCDLCGQPALHVSLPVTVGEAPLRTIDLCDGHHQELVQGLLQALDEVGYDPAADHTERQRRHRVDRTTGPFKCQIEGCIAAPLKHRGSFHGHLRTVHRDLGVMSVGDYEERYGKLVPLTPEEQGSLVVTARCPEKGCSTEYSTATGTRWPRQALVSHLRGVHAIKM